MQRIGIFSWGATEPWSIWVVQRCGRRWAVWCGRHLVADRDRGNLYYTSPLRRRSPHFTSHANETFLWNCSCTGRSKSRNLIFLDCILILLVTVSNQCQNNKSFFVGSWICWHHIRVLKNYKVNENFSILDNSHLKLFLIEIWIDAYDVFWFLRIFSWFNHFSQCKFFKTWFSLDIIFD